MTLDDFRTALDALPEEERDSFLQALVRDYGMEEGLMSEELGNANRFLNTPMPGMRDSGRFVTAANPLEFASTLANRAVGEGLRRDARASGQGIADARSGALGQLQQLMLGQSASPQGQMNTPQPSIVDLLRGGKPF